ncbi:hypothetical protein FVE67_03255 [Thermosulfurimonas marina]|uniref:Uncharacterized protein n=1 Tax=Thermosulfurimonas marina TaxID=2047767 RepID=A0A6H1WRU2_9BACT|nr:hypothetical protein [Thermosulfurimonas marina]QJA05874.1 hypothetical protein FVE67_03255 [Thermosulfurimonas marina]
MEKIEDARELIEKPPPFGRGDAHLRELYQRMRPGQRLEVALSLGDLLIELRRALGRKTISS